MAKSDAPMMGVRRATNHPLAAGTVLKSVATIKGVSLHIMRKLCENSFRRVRSVIFRPGMGINYIQFSHFSYMHCGYLISAHNFFKVNFQFINGVSQLRRGRVLYIVITISNTVV